MATLRFWALNRNDSLAAIILTSKGKGKPNVARDRYSRVRWLLFDQFSVPGPLCSRHCLSFFLRLSGRFPTVSSFLFGWLGAHFISCRRTSTDLSGRPTVRGPLLNACDGGKNRTITHCCRRGKCVTIRPGLKFRSRIITAQDLCAISFSGTQFNFSFEGRV